MLTKRKSDVDDSNRYSVHKIIGEGSYGVVFLGHDKRRKSKVAIKKVCDVDSHPVTTIRTLREFFLLHSLRHDNIISLYDVHLSNQNVLIVAEYGGHDLHKIIYFTPLRAPPVIQDVSECIYILYQMLKVIRYLHALNIIHRDIKPENILIRRDEGSNRVLVKLCDFGFARVIDSQKCDDVLDVDSRDLTEYMGTRFYRAPEMMLCPGRYGKAQDVWATGCCIAELLRKQILFAGNGSPDQVQVIVDVLGRLKYKDKDFHMSKTSRKFLSGLKSKGIGLRTALNSAQMAHPDLFSLLKQMLQFNPKLRITSSDAIALPIFSPWNTEVETGSYLPYPMEYLKEFSPSMARMERKMFLHDGVASIQHDLAEFRRQHRMLERLEKANGPDNYSSESESTVPCADVLSVAQNADGSSKCVGLSLLDISSVKMSCHFDALDEDKDDDLTVECESSSLRAPDSRPPSRDCSPLSSPRSNDRSRSPSPRISPRTVSRVRRMPQAQPRPHSSSPRMLSSSVVDRDSSDMWGDMPNTSDVLVFSGEAGEASSASESTVRKIPLLIRVVGAVCRRLTAVTTRNPPENPVTISHDGGRDSRGWSTLRLVTRSLRRRFARDSPDKDRNPDNKSNVAFQRTSPSSSSQLEVSPHETHSCAASAGSYDTNLSVHAEIKNEYVTFDKKHHPFVDDMLCKRLDSPPLPVHSVFVRADNPYGKSYGENVFTL